MKNLKKLMIILLLVICAAVPLIASGQSESTTADISEETTAESSERTVTVTDMSGDSVTITGEVNKIVNLWPAGTSSFFVMGAGDLIAGLAVNNPGTMNSWTQLFYPKCTDIPALGGITPSVEDIINLNPDLVIIHPTTAKSGFARQIRDVGIPAININFSDYETMIQAYTIIGEILGGKYQERLGLWCEAVETRLSNVRRLTAEIPEENLPVVYYTSGQRDSLTQTMPSGYIINDWVESAGGIYASDRMDIAGSEVTPEAVFNLNPDVIICGGVYQHRAKDAFETVEGWRELKAVSDGRVYTNPYGCFNWDRFGLESLLQINYALLRIQPETAEANGITENSIIGEIIDFYKNYTDFELSRTQAENMFNGLRFDGTAEFPVE